MNKGCKENKSWNITYKYSYDDNRLYFSLYANEWCLFAQKFTGVDIEEIEKFSEEYFDYFCQHMFFVTREVSTNIMNLFIKHYREKNCGVSKK